MMILHFIGKAIVFVIKTVLKILMGALWLALEMLKIFLMLFGMVFRVFLAFVDAGTA